MKSNHMIFSAKENKHKLQVQKRKKNKTKSIIRSKLEKTYTKEKLLKKDSKNCISDQKRKKQEAEDVKSKEIKNLKKTTI